MTCAAFVNSPLSNLLSISTMLACKRICSSTMVSSLRALRGNEVVCGQLRRCLSTGADGEVRIAKILRDKFPLASSLKVVDISGGCGAMYEIHIESSEFKGKRTVQQHQLVNKALKDEIQGMHGLRIFTDVPKEVFSGYTVMLENPGNDEEYHK